MGALTGAIVVLLAKDMASAIASEMGKDGGTDQITELRGSW
jgi:hypothetical protein